MPRIFVVTHPEADHHVQGLIGGWYDSHLTEAGHRDARAIADRLRSEIGDDPVSIYASDLARTMETAAPIADRFGVEIEARDGLRELSQGEAGGKPTSWLDRLTIAPDHDRLDHVSGPGAESKRAFVTRVYAAMDEIVADPTPTRVVVTHGYAMTFVVAAWIGMPIESTGFVNFRSTSGGITLLEQDDVYRNRAVRFVDDTSHLPR